MEGRKLSSFLSMIFTKLGKQPKSKRYEGLMLSCESVNVSEDIFVEIEKDMFSMVSVTASESDVQKRIKVGILSPVDKQIHQWFTEVGLADKAMDVFKEKNTYLKIKLALDKVRELTKKYEI